MTGIVLGTVTPGNQMDKNPILVTILIYVEIIKISIMYNLLDVIC